MGILDKAIANSVPYMLKSFVQRISRRYAAGHEASDAVRVARYLSRQGCRTTAGVLGEFVPTEQYTKERLSDYKRAVDAMEDLRDPNLDNHVTLKLTDLGLTLDEDLCRKDLEEILLYAKARGRCVEVDMEETPYVSATLDMTLEMHERHGDTGAVVQAYLRRTLGDLEHLIEAGIPVRLVKGVYLEPMEVAYQDLTSCVRTTCSCSKSCSGAGSTPG